MTIDGGWCVGCVMRCLCGACRLLACWTKSCTARRQSSRWWTSTRGMPSVAHPRASVPAQMATTGLSHPTAQARRRSRMPAIPTRRGAVGTGTGAIVAMVAVPAEATAGNGIAAVEAAVGSTGGTTTAATAVTGTVAEAEAGGAGLTKTWSGSWMITPVHPRSKGQPQALKAACRTLRQGLSMAVSGGNSKAGRLSHRQRRRRPTPRRRRHQLPPYDHSRRQPLLPPRERPTAGIGQNSDPQRTHRRRQLCMGLSLSSRRPRVLSSRHDTAV